jgi:hypothetical protein
MALEAALETSSAADEPLLAKARLYLDARDVSDSERAAFFASLEAALTDDSTDGLVISERLIPVWKDVLRLIGRRLHLIPAAAPVTADAQLHQLIESHRASQKKSFAEQMTTSPIRNASAGPAAAASPADFESTATISPCAPAEPPKLEVVMTESEHELLRKALGQRSESKSKYTVVFAPPDRVSGSEDVPLFQLDASAVVAASSSDFKIDAVTSLSDRS